MGNIFYENFKRTTEHITLSQSAKNALWLLCTHADENGFVIVDVELWALEQYNVDEAHLKTINSINKLRR